MFGDRILLSDINNEVKMHIELDEIYDDKTYTFIDKQALGETIAKELLDDNPGTDYEDNCNIIYEEINKDIDDIVDDIFNYVFEYINNNQFEYNE